MKNINEMRELKNVVNQLMSESDSFINEVVKIAREESNMYIHNLGNSVVVTGSLNNMEYNKAKASRYIYDLIHAINSYKEDGNSVTFTINNPMYPNAESFEWD